MNHIVRRSAWLACAVAGVGCRQELPKEHIIETEPPVIAAVRPPPLAGGTLLVTRDQLRAIASDPERDRVLVIDFDGMDVRAVGLEAGDEPGRGVEDADGRVHVALRRSGDVVTIDSLSATIVGRRPACSSPRGVAYDPARDAIHVACADGQLVTLTAEPSGAEVRRVFVEPDLRDVLVRSGGLAVTTFRSAELLSLDAAGVVVEREAPPPVDELSDSVTHEAHVAWRALVAVDGSTLLAHQMELSTTIDVAPPDDDDEEEPIEGGDDGAYVGVGCEEQLVRPAISALGQDGVRQVGAASISQLRLMIDMAVSSDGAHLAVVDPATAVVVEVNANDPFGEEGCFESDTGQTTPIEQGTPIAIAFVGADILVQTREPASVVVVRGGGIIDVIDLGGDAVADTGFDLFYGLGGLPTSSGVACASCHPEGRDDGHVWDFSDVGRRRTQSLAGTIAGTAPFHWGGELEDVDALMAQVFTDRMAGPRESPERVKALQSWIETIPPVRAVSPATETELEHGRALFESETVGCASCHSNKAFTNNETVDVGTGQALQVPSLVGVGARAPYMHDGCAGTMIGRFDDSCGGGDEHGKTSQLEEADLRDLVSYTLSL